MQYKVYTKFIWMGQEMRVWGVLMVYFVVNPAISELLIHGDKTNYPIFHKNMRYHLVIPTVPREIPSTLEASDCDTF